MLRIDLQHNAQVRTSFNVVKKRDVTQNRRGSTLWLHQFLRWLAAPTPIPADPPCMPLVWVIYDKQEEQWLLQSDLLLPDLEQSAALPRLILLDLNMQRRHGAEILQRLRATIAYHHLSIVVLTTSNAQLNSQMSLQLGTGSFLTTLIEQTVSVITLEKLALH